MNDPVTEYQRRYDTFLKKIAQQLEEYVKGCVAGISNIDRISARAKDPARFSEKATRKDKQGNLKYQKPLTELQDLVGARIVVFYQHDVDIVVGTVTRYFHAIEEKELVPESEWSFGYFGKHLVLALPKDVVPDGVDLAESPRFFECQIKTLFQHAWSEANHDLGYKARTPLSRDQVRRVAYTAAQAWGADRAFEELRGELHN